MHNFKKKYPKIKTVFSGQRGNLECNVTSKISSMRPGFNYFCMNVMLKHVEKLSKQWHITDTGQIAQTEAPIWGGIKWSQLCGAFNQEHPQHQSQHTNTIKSI